ncbi:uncharacterized protein Triagg1_6542 [Trichoderma aggressivum f. europaeum]|uniref:Uncharacterized protein n=1 Tax=Trichoderma aggressivum f. europaeum TaxID=173218 RepID=A0AAE1IF00_9HYPO|nr:hypothetical protein Triagg1_6542 [Trichoderma aggressivum f. europaeum]
MYEAAQAKAAEGAIGADAWPQLNFNGNNTTSTALGLPEGATYSLVHLQATAQGGGSLATGHGTCKAHVRVPEHPGRAGGEGEGEGEAWGKTETLLGHHTVRPGGCWHAHAHPSVADERARASKSDVGTPPDAAPQNTKGGIRTMTKGKMEGLWKGADGQSAKPQNAKGRKMQYQRQPGHQA